jgi:Raf kinase inhibitor-like YbhB/YbcL family protein
MTPSTPAIDRFEHFLQPSRLAAPPLCYLLGMPFAQMQQCPPTPRGTFIHWVLAGLQPTATGLAEGEHPAAAVEGRNDFGEEGYGGPMPPVGHGPHRYFFRIYAASAPLGLTGAPSAEDLRRALDGKELASGTLVGTYQR